VTGGDNDLLLTLLGTVMDVDWLSIADNDEDEDEVSTDTNEVSLIVGTKLALDFLNMGSFIFLILSAKRVWKLESSSSVVAGIGTDEK
jgi:hypothetical protein